MSGYQYQKKIILILITISGLIFSCGQKEKFENLGIGGEIKLQSLSDKEWVLSKNTKPINLVFFGYTACPDFCPMTLAKFKKLNQILGKDQEKVQYIFVSLDHKRDTPEKLDDYVKFYVPNGVGLSGSEQEIAKVLDDYKGSFSWNGDFIDHSTYTYLVDAELKTRYLFKHKDSPESLAKIIRLLL
ncbi:MAG: SCO family protein [Leptospira sp.]|nr:SCO family protein [Leptospira sp.]